MDEPDATRIHRPLYESAFLIVQRGDALLEVVELPANGRLTVGRASSNRIVLQDPKCSREHCEIFHQGGQWYLRDLDSRNGLTVNKHRVAGDHSLKYGETIGIGLCTLLFSDKHPDHQEMGSGSRAEADSGFQIIERQAGTQFDNPSIQRVQDHRDGATELFQMARLMAAPTTVRELSRVVLEGLLTFTGGTLGGVLLDVEAKEKPNLRNTKAFALQGCEDSGRLSTYLTQIVLDEQNAILAHDISKHSAFAAQDSLQELAAESAICAPIRHGNQLYGVVHIYCVNAENPMTQSDLEFVLAVADQMGDHLHTLLEKEQLAVGLQKSKNQISELQDQLGAETELVGNSPALDAVRKSILRVAPTDALVLIRGESGVGKELVARAVHFNSLRKEEAFICVNCAALTESLLESELFGHEKGAFTGASARRAGKFEQADGGTLFLDEIGEMNLEIQAKFLRIIEGQPFERVGGGDPIQVDVRVVTATNRDLEEAVREGTFRRDLYFRLQVIEINVPALREYPEDIPAIAQHFVDRFSSKSNFKTRGFGTAAVRKLQAHPWPGNVRELRNVVERAVILSDHEVLQPEDVVLTNLRMIDDLLDEESKTEVNDNTEQEFLETSVDPMVDLFGSFIQQETSLDELDRYYIQAVLEFTEWNKSKASRVLQIERTTLDRRLKKYGISRPGGDEGEE